MTNQDRSFRIHSRYLKICLISSLLAVTSLLTVSQEKVKVYHCSVDGEKYDKKVTPEDSKIIKEAIKAWEAFDYKKALFETFLPVSKTKDWDEIAPKPGTAGQFIDDDKCKLLFPPGENGLYCSFGAYRLKLKERTGLIALPDSHYYYYFILEDEKGKTIWKRKSPVDDGEELWCLPVLPFPNEVGLCFFDGEDAFQSLALYILDTKTGKIRFKQGLPSEENFLGYCDYGALSQTKPIYYDGLIVMKPSYKGSEYFQNKYKDMPLVVIDLRPLLRK